MASNKPNKTPMSGTPRVPSNVPNDYEHLGVPGSLNMPLSTSSRRRRPQARQRGRLPNWAKAVLAIAGMLLALGIVALVIFLIAFPPYFRGMEPRYQARIIDMFPPATYWMKPLGSNHVPLPQGASNSEDALKLLLSATPLPSATAGAGVLPEAGVTPSPALTSTPEPTSDGGIPVGMAATPVDTPLPSAPTPTNIGPTWTPTEPPLPPSARLYNIRYEQQGWNNCGPTTLTMALSYYGWSDNEYTAANWLKPNQEDKNVSPWQMVRFVLENTSVKALYRFGGTTQTIKRLVAAGFPVIIEEGFQPAGEDWMGHYLLVMGYDDSQGHFLAYDSYLGSNQGEGRPHPYTVFDDNWRHFNRLFIVLYDPSREMDLRQALGEYVDPANAYRIALETAREEAGKNPEDKWAWFNMGSAYVSLGDYNNAAMAYDMARQQNLPWRMLWYQFGPYEAYYNVGRYSDVLALAESVLANTPYVEETYYWQGMAYAAEGNTNNALNEFNEALRYNRNFFPAQDAKSQLELGTFQAAIAP